MIPRDIAFHRVETLTEAARAWHACTNAGGKPLYYAGGTEIVTLAREHKIEPTDLVDIKAIQETRVLAVVTDAEQSELADQLQYGAALTLSTVSDTEGFPLLQRCAAGVADRTVRNSITLGGNICGMLPYREAILPFLLLDGEVETVLAGPEPEIRRQPLTGLFRKRLNLQEGELVVRFVLDPARVRSIGTDSGPLLSDGATDRPPDTAPDTAPDTYGAVSAHGTGPGGGWFYYRRTTESRIDYPIVTVAMILLEGELRVAVTGTWGYPCRAIEAEEVFRQAEAGAEAEAGAGGGGGRYPASRMDLATRMVDAVQLRVKDDMRSSGEYRRELTIQAVADGLAVLTRGGER